MGFRVVQKGDFKNTQKILKRIRKFDIDQILHIYGKAGVDALSSATPVESGETAASWGYEIHHSKGTSTIEWTNSHMNQGVSIAILLQYGHGTGTGGYVQGIDYINPAIRPTFEKLADAAWKEVVGE